ncbi:MAG TPA: hypothetical protein VM901_13100 [Bdellovibrionota bacterium]|jgi:hypothetical protein|nr:hypothetical protein [Bdellovibrionota bacterium]
MKFLAPRSLGFFALIGASAHAGLGPRLKNNAAVKRFASGDVAGADAAINDALAGDAANPLILYNWASANLLGVMGEMAKEKKNKLSDEQKKRVESAQKEFGKLLAQDSPFVKKLSKEILYQNAQSLELLEKNNEALVSYYRSLHSPAESPESDETKKLTEMTQTNIAHLLVKSQSSSSGEGSGGGGGSEGEKEQGQGEGEGDQKDGKKDSGQSQGQGQRREPEFTGTDVNQSQAQQILNSVSNQDRQVQQRKGQQQSKQNMQEGEEGDVSPTESDRPW